MHIRAAQQTDISILSEYWYDNMVVLQQTHPYLELMPNPRQAWEHQATQWIADDSVKMLASTYRDSLTGCMIGVICDNSPGMMPRQYGLVLQYFLDLHTIYPTLGTGQALFDQMKRAWMHETINQCRVRVWPNAPVQQAFWRGMGAKPRDEHFWLSL